jgi:serpin B
MRTSAARGVIAAAIGALALVACAPASTPDRPTPSPGEAAPLAHSLNDAGFAIFRAAATDGGNTAVSPLSIGLAFGMVDAGASGSVKGALDKLFAYPSSGEPLLGAFNSLDLGVVSEKGSGAKDATGKTVDLPVVRVANRAFIDESFTPAPAYLDTIGRYFGAGAQTEPLRTQPDKSRKVIDGWVSDRTQGLIPKIMPDSLPNPYTALILVNTVYLKAQWWSPFEHDTTSARDFHLAHGTVVQADTMGQGLDASYAQTDAFDAAVLPYVGDLEMVLVVPRDGSYDSVEAGMSQAFLDTLDASWKPGHIEVDLPRFSAKSTTDLRDVIENRLGITGLFDTVGLDGIGPDLHLDAAVHSVRVIVDEKGTEAAAATVVGVAGTSMPQFDAVIRADRPFLYVIRDVSTGAVLIVGRVLDPRE